MAEKHQEPGEFRQGDKVRVRTGIYAGTRGIVSATDEELLEIETLEHDLIRLESSAVTNYSLAARRAWQAMPKRAGRPRLNPDAMKKLVSMRLDPDVWNRLGQAVELGLVESRESAANMWIRQKLDDLFGTTAHQ